MNILTRKIKIIPVGDKTEIDRAYKYIRDGQFSQNLAMNQYLSALYMSAIIDASKDDRKELNKLYTRISTSKKGSAYDTDIIFPTGLPTASSLGQKVKQDFQKQVKDGLLYGKTSLATYRKDNPLLVHVDYVRLRSTNPHKDNGIYHNYESHEEFLNHLYDNDLEVFIKFSNGIIFKIVFGSPHKSRYLREEFRYIFEEHFKVCGSQISVIGKEIILFLSIECPDIEHKLDENTVVGVDIGLCVPAVCGLNNDDYKREYCGSIHDFINTNTKFKAQRRRLYSNMKYSKSGHGRNRKLRSLEKLKKREANWRQNYNHYISKSVVDFALKNNAKYINIEDLSGFKNTKHQHNNFVLENWTYYQLQQYITYKAKKHGITVRKINPRYTSQKCSKCGNLEEGQRLDQSTFMCKKCGYKANADFNASRNIAMSDEFVK